MQNRDKGGGYGWGGERDDDRERSPWNQGSEAPWERDCDCHVDRGTGGYSAGGRDWSSTERRPFGDCGDARFDCHRAGGDVPRPATGPFGGYDEGYGIYGGSGGTDDDEGRREFRGFGERHGSMERSFGRGAPQTHGFPAPRHGVERSEHGSWRGGMNHEGAMTGTQWGRTNDAPAWGSPGRAFGDAAAQVRPGRGPKNYTRSDERIREDVIERIVDNGLDASEVEIEVKEGEVTLTGSVHQRLYKHRMEDIAESVSGVKDVHNQIRVKRQGEDVETREAEVMSTDASTAAPGTGTRRGGLEPSSVHKA